MPQLQVFQSRLSAEMVLLVIAEMRRGLKALNSVFGNKIAILAGDFLLARASVSLAALRDSEVIQLLSQVIEDLVTGEILQVRAGQNEYLTACPVLVQGFACVQMEHAD